jgi:hypothetical protein
MKLYRWIVPLLALMVLFGSIGVAKAFGWWQVSGTLLILVQDVSPEDIRGSSSLGDLSTAFGIPLSELYTLLSIPETFPPETQLKELEEYNEVSTVRGLVAEHLGLPWEWEETDQAAETAPTQAVAVTTVEATVAPEPTHTGPTPIPVGSTLLAEDIKGSMTLQQVSDGTGMPLEDLLTAANLPADTKPTTALRDLVSQVPGFEVSLVRDAVTTFQAPK